MAKRLYAFVRFFKTESHRDSFLRGDLYMNRLKFFKEYEEQDACNIGDRHEGIAGWYQPDQIRLTIKDPETGEDHLIQDFAGPISVGWMRHDDYHVYCMSAIYADEDSRFETFRDLESSMMLDVGLGDLGDYCSIIEARVFIERLDKVLKVAAQAGDVVGRGLVEYFNAETFSGSFEEDLAIMRKKDCFSHQKEYRIFVYNGTSGDVPRILSIGDLSDVAVNCFKADLSKHVAIDLKS